MMAARSQERRKQKPLVSKWERLNFMIRNDAKPCAKTHHIFIELHALRRYVTKRVQDVVREFAPECEVYSIDELFAKLERFTEQSALSEHARAHARGRLAMDRYSHRGWYRADQNSC